MEILVGISIRIKVLFLLAFREEVKLVVVLQLAEEFGHLSVLIVYLFGDRSIMEPAQNEVGVDVSFLWVVLPQVHRLLIRYSKKLGIGQVFPIACLLLLLHSVE